MLNRSLEHCSVLTINNCLQCNLSLTMSICYNIDKNLKALLGVFRDMVYLVNIRRDLQEEDCCFLQIGNKGIRKTRNS